MENGRGLNEFMQFVIEDVEKYKDNYKPVKASILERLLRKKANPSSLHPNFEDEFSIPGIGPNFEIIGNYKNEIITTAHMVGLMFPQAIIVEKMKPEGFLIINGHHRWAAAKQMGLKAMKVKVVNLVHKEDIERMRELCGKEKAVAFDLDEVVFSNEEGKMEEALPFPKNKQFTERIRKGIPKIFRALKEKGYDIWVYTSGYGSEEYIRKLLTNYDAEPAGIINGFGEKRTKEQKEMVKELMDSYKEKMHIDIGGVVVTHPDSKEYQHLEVKENGSEWSEEILGIIKNLK